MGKRQHKRNHQRHHQRQPGEQQFLIQVVTGESNIYHLFLSILYITRRTINNNTPHLKSVKNQNIRAALGRPAILLLGGLELVCGRPTLALSLSTAFEVGGHARHNWSNLFMIYMENLDGAHNRRHKQTDLIIMDFAMAFDKVPIDDLYTNWRILVSGMIFVGGSQPGYLDVHKKLFQMVNIQTVPLCCLVSPKGSVLGPI